MERTAQKNKAHTVFRPSYTPCWFASTPPIRTAIQLAHNQSENPMAQTSDSPPPQTLHAESKPTTSARLRKLPTQLNTPNILVPDLVRVSPNASNVQRLGRCVPAWSRAVEVCGGERGRGMAAGEREVERAQESSVRGVIGRVGTVTNHSLPMQ